MHYIIPGRDDGPPDVEKCEYCDTSLDCIEDDNGCGECNPEPEEEEDDN